MNLSLMPARNFSAANRPQSARRLFLTSSCLALTLSAAALAGDWPSVINQMPDDAQIVICTKPLKDFDDHYSQFTAAIEVAQLELMPSPIDALFEDARLHPSIGCKIVLI